MGKLAAPLPRSRSHPRLARARVHSRLGRSPRVRIPDPAARAVLPHPPLPGLPPGLSPAPPPPPSVLALAELPPLPALPLRPAPAAPADRRYVALPELPPEACVPAPPAALALRDLPRLPAPAPLPSHLPLPPLPEAAAAASPGPVGARGRPPLIAEPPPQPLPPLLHGPRPSTCWRPRASETPGHCRLTPAAAAAAPAVLLLPVASLLKTRTSPPRKVRAGE